MDGGEEGKEGEKFGERCHCCEYVEKLLMVCSECELSREELRLKFGPDMQGDW